MEKRRDLAFPLIPQKHNILAATRRTCNSIRPQPRSIQASKNKSLTNICDHNILSLFALGQAGCQKHSRTVLLQIERDYRSGGSVRKIVAGKEIENRGATKIPSATLFATAFLFCFQELARTVADLRVNLHLYGVADTGGNNVVQRGNARFARNKNLFRDGHLREWRGLARKCGISPTFNPASQAHIWH